MSGALADLRLDDFLTWLGRECAVGPSGDCVVMTLVKAEPLAGSPRPAGGFRLEFLGPFEPILPQQIHPVSREEDRHEVFMGPIARDPRGILYEAVFY